MIWHNIQLIGNLNDDNHCFQACLKMVLTHFDSPKKGLTLLELDGLTGHISDKNTWEAMGILWLQDNGFEVMQIEPLDYARFCTEGLAYLKGIMKPDFYEYQIKNSDIHFEQENAAKLVKSDAKLLVRSATIEDVIEALDNGYLPMVSVNPFIIRGEKGQASHMIVITGYDDQCMYANDPGLPAKKLTIPRNRFSEALYSAMLVRPRHNP